MKLDPKVTNIVEKVFADDILMKNDIEFLLRIPEHSIEAGFIMASADVVNRSASNNKAEVHAQIGLNISSCAYNCEFCAFAEKYKIFKERNELSNEETTRLALEAEGGGANAIFFMTTGDYPFNKFVEISMEVRSKLRSETVMIANIGDFSCEEGEKLKEVGYTGIYHAVRMGEGRDTRIDPETRLNTMRAARKAGLLLGTCVEPVGPEHSIDEIAEKIIMGRELNPCFSGVMRRINIPDSEFTQCGMISEYRLALLVSITRLAMGKTPIGNCTHEPNMLGLIAGANLLWAEAGANPRDTEIETSKGRGLDVKTCIEMFKETGFEALQGPSMVYNEKNCT